MIPCTDAKGDAVSTNIKLNDPELLRAQCYVDGEWVDATGGGTIEVDRGELGGARFVIELPAGR